jgi:hypothetical protein
LVNSDSKWDALIGHIADPWNIIDIFPPFLIFLNIAQFWWGKDPTVYEKDWWWFEITCNVLTSILMWLKLLYFLRVFENFSFFIRMLVNIFSAIRYFSLVLLITMMAFGEGYEMINKANQEPFIES